MHEFKAGAGDSDFKSKVLRRSLYTSPELLRHPSPPARGTQKGDVYSFGVVLYEILGRAGPWGHLDLSMHGKIKILQLNVVYSIFSRLHFTEIIDSVKYRGLRPNLDELGAAEYITKCIKACWHEEPEQRPDIRYVRVRLKEMQVRYSY